MGKTRIFTKKSTVSTCAKKMCSLVFGGDFLLLVVGVLGAVAFFTLMERKFLGYFHFRKGPTKILLFGLFQPFRDALKLFSKEMVNSFVVSMVFFVSPIFGLSLMVALWGRLGGVWSSSLSFLLVFCLISLGVYFVLFCGWGGGRKYSLLGGFRGVAQVMSYEVCLVLFALVFSYFFGFYNLRTFFFFQHGVWLFFFRVYFFFCWVVVCVAEVSRTPFDFSEGESELVSGFNVEYGGGLFSIIFVCEYGMLLFFSFLIALIFFGGGVFKSFLFSFFFLWIRGTLPRFRYDLLMVFSWKSLLFLSFGFLSFMCFFS